MRQISYKLLIPAALITIAVLINPAARAVGLGPVEVDSRLNQPLKAEIPLLSVAGMDADEITVRLAEPEDFERIGLERRGVLAQLTFSVEQTGSGPMIRVSSEEPIREPFLNFLLRVDWPQGRLLREYTILLDPPVLAPASAPEPEQAPSREIEREPQREAQPEPGRAEQPAQARPSDAAPAPGTERESAGESVGGGEYGPVRSGETLWRIANSTRPDGITANQMMMALLRTNPDAFFEDNINALKRGAVLRVPGRGEIASLSASEALQAVQNQNDLWQDYRRNLARSAPAVVEGGEAPARTPDTADDAGDQSRLELVPPRQAEEGASEAVAGAGEPGLDVDSDSSAEEIRRELSRTREALLAEEQQSDRMEGRVQELEGQVERLQRLLEMKNEELAALQQGQPAESAESDPFAADTTDTASTDDGADTGFGDEPEAAEESATTAMTDTEDQGAGAMDEPSGDGAAEESETADEPATPTAPPPEPERQGWLEWLLSPVVLGIGGLLLIGIGVALFLHRRRAGEAETTLQRESLEVGRTRQRAVEEEDEAGDDQRDEIDSGPQEAGPADYDAAALKAALSENPEDSQTRLKLMRHYAATQQADAFVAEAETLYAQLADPSDPAWQEASELAQEVAPDNPLFSGGGDIRSEMSREEVTGEHDAAPPWEPGETAPEPEEPAAPADRDEPPTPAEEATSGEREPGDGLPDLEFESPGLPEKPEESGKEPEGGEYSLDDLDTGEEGYDFDLDEDSEAGRDDETRQRETLADAAAADDGEKSSADNEFDFGEMAEPRSEGGADEDLAGLSLESDESGGEAESEEPSPEVSEESTGEPGGAGGSDAVGTKLELAEAYLDMADEEGARELLDEVMKEGDDSQQARAKELLDKLGQ